MNCTGNETTLFKCSIHLTSIGVSLSYCANNDAGVICQGMYITLYPSYIPAFFSSLIAASTSFANCTNGDVRLAGGLTPTQGNVEICINGAWGTVCDDGWGIPDSNVLCRQLGYQAFG